MRRCAADGRGMSLIELLVAVALSTVVLLGATFLLIALAKACDREMGRPPAAGGAVDLALTQVERDLRVATRVVPRHGEWSSRRGTLLLELPDGALAGYHSDGERFLRLVGRVDEPDLRVRTLLEDVAVADIDRQGGSSFDVWLRVRSGELRHRIVLARNLERPGSGPRTRRGP